MICTCSTVFVSLQQSKAHLVLMQNRGIWIKKIIIIRQITEDWEKCYQVLTFGLNFFLAILPVLSRKKKLCSLVSATLHEREANN